MTHQINLVSVDLFCEYYGYLYYEPNFPWIVFEAKFKVGLNCEILYILNFMNLQLNLVIFVMLKKKYDEENR